MLDENTTVMCDGSNMNMGHPKIYLKLAMTQPTICPYCSKIFEFEKSLSFLP